MSMEEMQKLEEIGGFFDTVNRGKDPAELDAAEQVYREYTREQERKEAPQVAECNPVDHKAETRYRGNRVRAFWRQVVEPAIGYVALGGVMVAAMVLSIVPAYVAIPVFSLCFIWTAIRADRFLREV